MSRATVIKRTLLILAVAVPVVAITAVTLRSRGRAVNPEDLAKLIDRADRLVVLQEPDDGGAAVFESSDRRDLDALKTALRVERPEQDVRCACYGTSPIVLYANGQKIGQLTNHHTKLIRCSLWTSDARLVDAEAFLTWFDARNIPGPRNEYLAQSEREKQWKEAECKWVEAMPPALKPFWPVGKDARDPDLAPLRAALAEQVPDMSARILALFSWYGSGERAEYGFPSYESVAENMLLDYSTAELIAAVEGKELTEPQTEGVVRLFTAWTFSRRRPNDHRLLPAELKARLLKHGSASRYENRRRQAQSAFGE